MLLEDLFTELRRVRILGSSLYQADPLCSGRPLTIEPGAPLWGQNGSDLIAVVAPFCIKGLRLVTMQLPEKFSPIGLGTNQSSHIRVSAKFALTEFSQVRQSGSLGNPDIRS
jgi:hypothetical protein